MSNFEKSLNLLDQLIAKLESNIALAQRQSQKTPKKHMANKSFHQENKTAPEPVPEKEDKPK